MGVSVFPVPSVERTTSFIAPVADGVHLKIQRRHVSAPAGVSSVAWPQVFPPSADTSTLEIPRLPANAIPPIVTSPPVHFKLRPGTSMRELVFTMALSDQPCCIQYPRKS